MLVLTALALTVLLGFGALSVDVGVAMSQRCAAQAADAAALAGAVDLPGVTQANAQAVSDATAAATANLAKSNLTSPVVTVNSPPVNSKSHNGDTSSVEVTITANAPVSFAGVLNSTSIPIKAHAIATGQGSLGTPPIAILDPAAADSLDVGEDTGNTVSSKYQPSGGLSLDCASSVTVTQINGPIYTNSVAADGEESHANCNLSASQNHVAGGDQIICDYSKCGSYSPPPVAGDGTQLPDPLAYLIFGCGTATAPYWASCPSGGGTPGQKGNTSCPNDCSGTTTSNCPTKCSPGGFVNIQSGAGGSFWLSAPTSGTYQGLTFFFDRNNYVTRPGSADNQETFNMFRFWRVGQLHFCQLCHGLLPFRYLAVRIRL